MSFFYLINNANSGVNFIEELIVIVCVSWRESYAFDKENKGIQNQIISILLSWRQNSHWLRKWIHIYPTLVYTFLLLNKRVLCEIQFYKEEYKALITSKNIEETRKSGMANHVDGEKWRRLWNEIWILNGR